MGKATICILFLVGFLTVGFGQTAENKTRQLFKIYMKLAKQEFTGTLIIKETSTAEYRSIFTTGPGIKIFDYTVKNDGFAVNYGIGPLQKKFIAKRLALTIQALLLREFPINPEIKQTGEGEKSESIKVGKYAYVLTYLDGKAKTQTVSIRRRKKAIAQFAYLPTSIAPDSGTVNHFGFPLFATFKQIKE